MRKRWWIAAFLLIGIGLQACAPKNGEEDCGFVQNVYGERISWKGDIPVQLHIHTSMPAQYHSAIYEAAKTWNRAAGKDILQIVGLYSGTDAARDGVNVISFATTWESGKLSEQARTSVHWVGDQIQEADIKINGATVGGAPIFSFYAGNSGHGVNIEALVLHEMGHVLGLKHKDSNGSVMATYLPSNTNRIGLAESDVDALKCEY